MLNRQHVRLLQKLLVITGPTATGKTALALRLAKIFGGEIISADSRQIYKDFDIGTGKEVDLLQSGRARKVEGGWLIEDTLIHLYDIVEGHKQFSAVAYAKKSRGVIRTIWQKNKLPILTGGTGFYIQATVDGIQTSGHEKDKLLREFLDEKSVVELRKILGLISPVRLNKLNNSDRNNPRRLERQIELALADTKKIPSTRLQMYPYMKTLVLGQNADAPPNPTLHEIRNPLVADTLFTGLAVDLKILAERIKNRVQKMVDLGLVEEVEALVKAGFTNSDPAFHTMGYSEFIDYFDGKISLETVTAQIALHSMQYAKCQYTWFKRDKRIKWFDITAKDYPQSVEKYVRKWYHDSTS